MRVAFFDCLNGAAGDMIVAALLDAGADFARLQADLARLPISGYGLEAFKKTLHGMGATRFEVKVTEPQPERHLRDIASILVRSDLPKSVVERATRVFHRLAVAEGKVHGMPPDQVHFHEVGAVDAIVDVVGAVLCMDQLGISQVVCSALPLGSGFVKCEHGMMPVPVPAVVELVRNVPVYDNGETGELVTPTGASILTTFAREFGKLPGMTLVASGFGGGSRDGQRVPNVLRVMVGEVAGEQEAPPAREPADELVGVIESNIDDQNPQLFEHVTDRLYDAGALDVFLTPVIMKKGRPGIKLTVILPPDRHADCQKVVFAETTTIGVRYYTVRRKTLDREIVSVQTDFGPIRVKVARDMGTIANLSPEYRDCVAAAQAKGVPLKQVWQTTLAQALAAPQLKA
ncbi:MAG: nickel pincer cofactor biosynthesis protein LarC [Candidatus Sericytochromatia bacterium]|nr:nickel pincer cofactor biosynthesis protein LarC [Candidatus Tanganyikabacteria bacterium]